MSKFCSSDPTLSVNKVYLAMLIPNLCSHWELMLIPLPESLIRRGAQVVVPRLPRAHRVRRAVGAVRGTVRERTGWGGGTEVGHRGFSSYRYSERRTNISHYCRPEGRFEMNRCTSWKRGIATNCKSKTCQKSNINIRIRVIRNSWNTECARISAQSSTFFGSTTFPRSVQSL